MTEKIPSVALKVQEAYQEEAYKGIVRIDSQTMREIGVKAGDIIEITGGRTTLGIVDRAYPSDIGQQIIRMDGLIRRNARTGIGESVKIKKAEVREAKSITIAPAQQGVMIQAANPELFKQGLLGRAVVKGDIISIGGARRRKRTMTGSPFEDIFNVFEDLTGPTFGFGTLKFVVADLNPKTPAIITENTSLKISSKAVEVTEAEEKVPEVTYEDIGGLEEEVKKIREMVELPLKNPQIFESLGISPPKGVLLHGPPGTGKTLLAKAVANETNANFILVNGPELLSKFYGETEKKIRNLFEEAEKNAPSIIFIDEIDAIAPKREETYGEVERRMVSQLLTMMDGLKSRGRVIVIGATNRQNALDPALRRPGRFDREIDIGVPNREGRLKILKIHTRNMPMTKDVKLDEIAAKTHGFVGADLESVCKEAAMNVIRREMPRISQMKDAEEEIPNELKKGLIVTAADFTAALKIVRPSSLREVLVEAPDVKWTDIGGLGELKQELQEAIEWPLKNPQHFQRMGIKPPRGILMYGPPGTGKTLLAKAVANESESNFILVKGPELLNKWVGESLPYDEEILVRKNGLIQRMKIGDIVENKEAVEVLTFDRDKRMSFSPVEDYIKHKTTSQLLEVTTRTGRKIKVTSDHSLFSFVHGKFVSLPTSYLIPGESYIAIPKRLNLPREKINNFNLYETFKHDSDILVGNVKEYLVKARKILGVQAVGQMLNVSEKYLYDIINKDLPVVIDKFDALMKKAGLEIGHNGIAVKLSGSTHSYPAIFAIDKDFWRLVGLWVAEGDLNGCTVRIHNSNKEIRDDAAGICKKYGFSTSENEKAFTINSELIQKVWKNVLGLETGAEKKRIPLIVFGLDKESKANFLKGYFSGDGSNYPAERGKFKIEAGTISHELANDILYLLLDFGIVATMYKKKERTGSTTHRISILGVRNFESFSNIGFIDKKRNERINEYILSRKWARSEVIPLSGELYELASQNATVTNAIGKERLKQILVCVDKEKTAYKEYWDLVDGDLFLDLVKEIKVIGNEEFVYDISVPDGENFVGGFGGVCAHNSEKGVRKIFERARQTAPTIIFFDEIDALATRRGLDAGSQVTERVVNALLAEMDGLEELTDVVVLAATNRPDLVDPALMRPGRFDRIIATQLPDEKTRLEILKINTKEMPLAEDVLLEELNKKLEDFSGADIHGLCREAAMMALRENIESKNVTMEHFEKALEKTMPSLKPEDVKRYKSIEEKYLRAARIAQQTNLGQTYMG